jgi:RES domain-containing protein
VILWRITNHRTLDGGGGLRASGRWHTRGKRIVYCAPNPATALVEILVHAEIDIDDVPSTLQYLEIEAPDALSTAAVTATHSFEDAVDPEKSRRIGDEWLHSGRTALLRVPSVVVPATWNVLINPQHPDSAVISIIGVHQHRIDRRLFRM